jgi:hypothetical protein
MSSDPAAKQRFLEQAKALSEQPKFVRYLAVTQLICGAVAYGIHDEAEIFDAAYGDPTGLDYWAAYLTIPISVALLANTLSAHTEGILKIETICNLLYFVPSEVRPRQASGGSLDQPDHLWP